jgi:hypothetical protein
MHVHRNTNDTAFQETKNTRNTCCIPRFGLFQWSQEHLVQTQGICSYSLQIASESLHYIWFGHFSTSRPTIYLPFSSQMNSAALYSSLQALNFHLIHPKVYHRNINVDWDKVISSISKGKMWKKVYLKYSNKAFFCVCILYLLNNFIIFSFR